jgi:hypothetical protein
LLAFGASDDHEQCRPADRASSSTAETIARNAKARPKVGTVCGTA